MLLDLENKIRYMEQVLLQLEMECVQYEYKFNTKQLIEINKKISTNSTTFLYMDQNKRDFKKMISLNYEKILFKKKLIYDLENIHVNLILNLNKLSYGLI